MELDIICLTFATMAAGLPPKACTVVLHDDSVSKEDVLCGTNILKAGTLAYLTAARTKVLCIRAQATAKVADEVSIHVAVARQFGFENRMKAMIEPIDDVEDATATHIEMLFRDQHLSRADMWRIKGEVDSTVLYQGQKLEYLGSTTVTVEAIYIAGQEVDSAYVSNPRTKLIFRSGSARFTILIQVSKEMLEYWNDGDLMYERLINGFLPALFSRWDELKVRHTLTVILFGRRLPMTAIHLENGYDPENDTPCTSGEDFFRVIAANIPSGDWRRVLRKLKRSFNSITRSLQVSLAAKGNMLQAIGLAAMDFANSNVDPPFFSTGTSITAITAGSGLFEADHELLRRTTTMLMGNSVGVDIISLSPKPLHPVPLFEYKKDDRWEYALPHWADVSYWHSSGGAYDSAWLLPLTSADVSSIALPYWEPTGDVDAEDNIRDILDTFDDQLFAKVGRSDNREEPPALRESQTQFKHSRSKTRSSDRNPSLEMPDKSHQHQNSGEQNVSMIRPEPVDPAVISPPVPKPRRDAPPPHPLMKDSRKISLGPRGPSLSHGVASTTVSAHNVQPDKEVSTSGSAFASNDGSSILAKQIRDSLRRKPSQRSLASQPPAETISISEPINIQREEQQTTENPADPASLIEKAVMDPSSHTGPESNSSLTVTPKAENYGLWNGDAGGVGDERDSVSPWLTLLNPCNPRRDNMQVASQYRQWQNIFPKAVSSGAFKWDSICTPAILPLMTESRVSLTRLERHSEKRVRRLLATNSSAHQAMLRMVIRRLIYGFQVVPFRKQQHPQIPSEQIDRMLLSLGDRYHELRCLSDNEVQVSEYEPSQPIASSDTTISEYSANIKPFASGKEQSQRIEIDEHDVIADWSALDDGSVNNTLGDELGQTKARFVLIPVDLPRAESHHRAQARELSDQERRTDGIQRLTQLWQRNRYFTDEDERHKSSMTKPKMSSTVDRDPNPLAIEYETRDPSAVVNAYGVNISSHLANGEPSIPLFAESERYHSSNFDMVKLVKQMQEPPPTGVELRDRRWFTRLHLKCFRGDEMTNWLLGVFKDLETREDAVALGNQIMDKDIFTHVRGKHEFRDGNYFYQIKSAHRTVDYPDTAGFFTNRMIGRSVPSTPITDVKQSPTTRPTQADSDSSSKGTSTPTLAPVDKEKKEVLFSQVLQYNVDPTKKSSQLEIVNLHYGEMVYMVDITLYLLTQSRSYP